MRIIVATSAIKSADPSDLCVSLRSNEARRNGHRVHLGRMGRVVLCALAAAGGGIVSKSELAEIAFGDDPNGGPEAAAQSIYQAIMDIRFASGVLGIVVTTHMTRGYSLRAWSREAA